MPRTILEEKYNPVANRWLSANMYSRINRKAKKLGAEKVDTKYFWHKACFKHAYVYFGFKPFEYGIKLRDNGELKCEDIESVKKDLDRAKEFVEYLKDFNKTVVESEG